MRSSSDCLPHQLIASLIIAGGPRASRGAPHLIAPLISRLPPSSWQADRERLEALQIVSSTRLVLVEVEQALALERTASAELRIAVRSTRRL
jgi:hypothetical protein